MVAIVKRMMSMGSCGLYVWCLRASNTCSRGIWNKLFLRKITRASSALTDRPEQRYAMHMMDNRFLFNEYMKGRDAFWLFGYGSIVWNPDFRYDQKLTGVVKGYSRRFYQLSTDHRGTPEKPGRVVTLVPASLSVSTAGIAYRIPVSDTSAVADHLNYREKDGYKLAKCVFQPRGALDGFLDVLTYIGRPGNPGYSPCQDLDEMARQIASSVGPSGKNSDYLFKLAESLRDLNFISEDDAQHLFCLEEKVRGILECGLVAMQR